MTDSLITRLQAADAMDRPLFLDVIKHLKPAFWDYLDANQMVISKDRERIMTLINVGAFLDAATALAERVLPGWTLRLSLSPYENHAYLNEGDDAHPRARRVRADDCETAPIAVCIAILKAQSGLEGVGDA